MSEFALTYETADHAPVAVSEEDGWVQRARAGDIDAFGAIMTQYEGRLLRFLGGLVGDIEVAQELCQDTFLAAYQALPRAQGEMRLSAWLHTIALNKARSHHRRRKLRMFVPLKADEVRSPSRDLQEGVAMDDTVRRTLQRMPRQYAHPLLLQTAGGLSCQEIAEVLNCSTGAAKVRLMRARESFKKIYEDEEREPCAS